MTPTVSVLMTSYNREKYIAEAINSILASSYKNFELIVVDDKSTDRTVEISNHFAMSDPRVKVYINKENLGDYPNRNMAASYASGKYIKYVDADDFIYPYGLQLLVEMMESNPSAGWGLCSLPQSKERPFPFVLNPYEAYKYHYFGPGLFHKAPLSSIIRKDLFSLVGGFTKERMISDTLMWHRLAKVSPVLLMQDGIVWYREHEGQESVDNHKFEFEYAKISIDSLYENDCPLSLEERKIILRARRNIQIKEISKCLVRFKIDRVRTSAKTLRYLNRKGINNA